MVYDGLTDGKSQTRALHEVVEFDKAFEDACLLVCGDAEASVFTVDVDALSVSTVFHTVPHTDMALLPFSGFLISTFRPPRVDRISSSSRM